MPPAVLGLTHKILGKQEDKVYGVGNDANM